MSEHCEHSQDVAGFVLGALSPEEHEHFADHITGCAACQRDVEELRAGASALALSVPAQTAPPELKQRLMATVSAEAELLRAAGADADRAAPVRPRRRGLFRLAAPLVAAAAVAVGAVVIVSGDDPNEPTRTVQATKSIGTSRAFVEVRGDKGRLIVDGVDNPPPGSVYALWLVRPGKAPEAAGTVSSVESRRIDTEIEGDLDEATQVLVTVERAPGPAAPTSDPVLATNLS